jgi:hypothetical protein
VDDSIALTVFTDTTPVRIYDPLLCAFADGTDFRTVKLTTAGNKMLERLNNYLNTGWYAEKKPPEAAGRKPAVSPGPAADAETGATAQAPAWPKALLFGSLTVAVVWIAGRLGRRTGGRRGR